MKSGRLMIISGATIPLSPVIPGRHEVANPESITPIRGYGFRACACGASRNDDGELG
jgi:hypothetical protein